MEGNDKELKSLHVKLFSCRSKPFYKLEMAMIEFQNDVLSCEDKFFDDNSESEDLLSGLNERIENVYSLCTP